MIDLNIREIDNFCNERINKTRKTESLETEKGRVRKKHQSSKLTQILNNKRVQSSNEHR